MTNFESHDPTQDALDEYLAASGIADSGIQDNPRQPANESTDAGRKMIARGHSAHANIYVGVEVIEREGYSVVVPDENRIIMTPRDVPIKYDREKHTAARMRQLYGLDPIEESKEQ